MSEKHKHLLILTEICKNLDLLAAIIHIGIPETKRNVQNEIPRPHFRYCPIPSLRVPSGTGDRGRHQQFQPRLGLMVIRDHTLTQLPPRRSRLHQRLVGKVGRSHRGL